MKTKKWIRTGVATAAVVLIISGCGGGSSTAAMGGSQAPTQTNGVAAGGSDSRTGNFQPTIDMKVSPSSPTAGKAFTITFDMQMPNRGQTHQGNFGNHTGHSTGRPPGRFSGNRTGNMTGGQYGAGHAPQATVVFSDGGVNQAVNLTSQNGHFEGTVTLAKAGSYQVEFTMDFGQRQIQKQFTLKVD